MTTPDHLIERRLPFARDPITSAAMPCAPSVRARTPDRDRGAASWAQGERATACADALGATLDGCPAPAPAAGVAS